MGKEKAGPLTPKGISNRIKAKGLQKLRWYCQMCQKQCRDENGFKCHTMSESHQRQLLLLAEDVDKYMDSFSREFQDAFLKLLKRQFGTRRVRANQVYQDYISDRHHTHMNATQWETLTDFVKWLGKEGHCKVDQTEKGWFLQYIDRDPETIERQKAAEAKEKLELDDDERQAKLLERQIERERARKVDEQEAVFTELKRENEEEKVTFAMPASKKKDSIPGPSGQSRLMGLQNPLAATNAVQKERKSEKEKAKDGLKRKSALEEIIQIEEQKKMKRSHKENWIIKGIIVKVVTKKLGERYYKKKGVIQDVQNLFAAVVKLLDSGDIIRLDQEHLETVIPALGKIVMVVNGAHRGSVASLVSLDEKSFSVTVELQKGPNRGKRIEKIPYEDICKLDT
ncbi:PREDICTED: DNA/RNA-binding protein KIN17-like [Acropora digitifera]|uniref:DNA/RNA-binding protein KIN17-like n=1 Tax=Acropora digitifera TaxID=70779 RepID=UPI00077B01EA|nr:PREDICTED: DNA/RNA-binding protein KIN17-like [Acropora digitifera]